MGWDLEWAVDPREMQMSREREERGEGKGLEFLPRASLFKWSRNLRTNKTQRTF